MIRTLLHFLPAQQSTSIALSLASCIMRLIGAESADATASTLSAAATLPPPISANLIVFPSRSDQILDLLSHLLDDVLHEHNAVRDLDIIRLRADSVRLTIDLLNEEIHLLTYCAVDSKDSLTLGEVTRKSLKLLIDRALICEDCDFCSDPGLIVENLAVICKKLVDPKGQEVQTARDLGISFGD